MTVTEPTVTTLNYERMVEDALRGVLRQALKITKSQGLPGSHHFYVTFDTTFPGVRIADVLHAMHPKEMTIVLQHQFWDLRVEEESFDITLSFNGVNQPLHVPFAAVTAFADPHAKFGLQFQLEFEDEDASDMLEDDGFDMPPVDNAMVTQKLKTSRRGRAETKKFGSKGAASSDEEESRKVVTLDAFRKKK